LEQIVNTYELGINITFCSYYAEQTSGARDALFDVTIEPWEVIDKSLHNWFEDFNEPVSCYTYPSFLGQDWLFPLISAGIQFTIPVVLALPR